MPKRWQGNSGRYDWVEPPPLRPGMPSPPPPPEPPPQTVHPTPQGPLGLQLLPKLLAGLETEDLLLLLMCWLLYRESGDSDWLIVLVALILG